MFLGSSLKGRSGMTTEFSRSPPEQSATESSRDVALQAELKAPRGPRMLLALRDPENDSAPSKQVRGPTGDLALDALVGSVA